MSLADNPRITAKERGLLKGALRRVFSRSELRRKVIDAAVIPGYHDPSRPRVTKWCKCNVCSTPCPKYLCVADHIDPVIPVHTTFEEMGLDQTADRLWSPEENLQPICPTCHRSKSSLERAQRKSKKKNKK